MPWTFRGFPKNYTPSIAPKVIITPDPDGFLCADKTYGIHVAESLLTRLRADFSDWQRIGHGEVNLSWSTGDEDGCVQCRREVGH